MQEEEVVQVSCWIDNIDRNKIPYIKEDDWRYSYPSLTPLNITKKKKKIYLIYQMFYFGLCIKLLNQYVM